MKRIESGRLRRWPRLWAGLMSAGLVAPARMLRARVAPEGWRVRFRADGIRLRRGDREVVAPLGMVYRLLLHWPELLPRFVFAAEGGRPVADLRGTARYRALHSGEPLWMTECVEHVDTVAGYLARGAPGPGQVVFDGGAFCGEFTVAAARLVGPAGRVIAFEPDEANRRVLQRNVQERGLSNVEVVPGGLWRETGEVEFAQTGDVAACIPVAAGMTVAATGRVPVFSLADAAARFGRPDFVKLDIEGAELEVVAGAAAWLREHRTRFAIASYHLRDGRPTAVGLEEMFRAAGYAVESGYPEHRTTWAGPEA